jgi:ABC-type microcin C transport system permease subunit YejB
VPVATGVVGDAQECAVLAALDVTAQRVAGFPAALIGILFTGSLLIEVIFSLDGLGLLGFEAAINRDYRLFAGSCG